MNKNLGARELWQGFAPLLLLVAISCASYFVLNFLFSLFGNRVEWLEGWLEERGAQLRIFASFFSFLVLPATILAIRGRGVFQDKKTNWLFPFIFYLLVFLLAGGFYFVNPDFYYGFQQDLSPSAIFWLVFLAIRVFSVDYFTKRVVQGELEPVIGPYGAQAFQLVAWMVGHVYEVVWLVPLWGYAGGIIFLLVTGVASGYIYSKGGSVQAFMVFHWLMNVGIAILVSL